MRKKIMGICISMLLIVSVVLPVVGTTNKRVPLNDTQTMKFAPGEFIVKLKKDTTFSISSLAALNERHHVYAIETIFPNAEGTILDNIYLLHVPLNSDVLLITQEYSSCPDVAYAEPNAIGYPCVIPNDANFSNQWHFDNTGQVFLQYGGINYSGTPDADIDAPEAWEIETGNPDVVVAVIDSGIDFNHPDLASKVWNNTDEIPGNGIDDDHNGYIDDIRSWDFYYNDSNVTDGYGHGTICAGVAGACTNNGLWGAGVAWNCKIMPVQIFNETGWTYLNYATAGIRYAADNGANVISMSFGWGNYSTLYDAVNYAYSKGVFLCAATGNSNVEEKLYPAGYDNVVAVAATNEHDGRCTPADWGPGEGSNYGDWVDIAAPGNIIFTTMPTYHCFLNNYGFPQTFYWPSGTSLSTPMVAGVAALLFSINTLLTPDQVKALLCENVDPYNSTEYIGTGRLNAQKALTALQLNQPTADFTWTPQNPLTTEQITFDASASHDPNGSISLYEWDWNNDGIYEEAHDSPIATHTWTDAGDYPVTLLVTDEDEFPDMETKTVTVNQHPPDNPTITGPEKGKPGSNYKYTITGTDPEEDMVSAYIMWGDDTITDWTTFHNSGDAFSVTHTWEKKGTYTVQVKVKDTHGAESGWTTLSVTIPFSWNIPFESFWMKLFEHFPYAFPILRHLMGF